MTSLRRQAPVTFVFGAIVAVGLAFAFVGLTVSSFWIDELFTAWIVGDGRSFSSMLSRALTDTHPPLYYSSLFLFAKLVGASEAGLRLFSAICAVLAMLAFLWGGRSFFSLPARLFAAAIAVGSNFWFYQSQNARSYSLCMLIGVGILILSLRILRDAGSGGSARRDIVLLTLLGLAGAFVHFYLVILLLSAMGCLFVLCPSRRLPLATAAAIPLLAAMAYIKLVVGPHSQWATQDSWIKGDAGWYYGNFVAAMYGVQSVYTAIAVDLCLILLGVFAHRTIEPALMAEHRLDSIRTSLIGSTGFALAVPLALFVAAVASSVVVAPNFTDRNFLICAPFLWAAFAGAYDLGAAQLAGPGRLAVDGALAILLLINSTTTVQRYLPRNEEYRQSARWIEAQPGCQSAALPVMAYIGSPTKGDFNDITAKHHFGYYLRGKHRLVVLTKGDFSAGGPSQQMLQIAMDRANRPGCKVLAWGVHTVSKEEAVLAARSISAALGREGLSRPIAVRSFDTFKPRIGRPESIPTAYVIHLN